MNRRSSQPDQVLSYLRQKQSINSVEAWGMYGISRLAAVIHRLRKRGHDIQSVERQGVRARYTDYIYPCAN